MASTFSAKAFFFSHFGLLLRRLWLLERFEDVQLRNIEVDACGIPYFLTQ
jgi:hypothetical protein